jgi:hypothetical protein
LPVSAALCAVHSPHNVNACSGAAGQRQQVARVSRALRSTCPQTSMPVRRSECMSQCRSGHKRSRHRPQKERFEKAAHHQLARAASASHHGPSLITLPRLSGETV